MPGTSGLHNPELCCLDRNKCCFSPVSRTTHFASDSWCRAAATVTFCSVIQPGSGIWQHSLPRPPAPPVSLTCLCLGGRCLGQKLKTEVVEACVHHQMPDWGVRSEAGLFPSVTASLGKKKTKTIQGQKISYKIVGHHQDCPQSVPEALYILPGHLSVIPRYALGRSFGAAGLPPTPPCPARTQAGQHWRPPARALCPPPRAHPLPSCSLSPPASPRAHPLQPGTVLEKHSRNGVGGWINPTGVRDPVEWGEDAGIESIYHALEARSTLIAHEAL